MSTTLDHRIGIKKETTYGTPVTVSRFYPYLDGTKSEWNARGRQGKGIISGARRTDLAPRAFLPLTGQGQITLKVELESKAAGVLLDLALGVSVVTAITGGSQINFHPGITGTVLPSATIQIVKVQNTGVEAVETYAGCTASKVTIEQPEDDVATLTVEFDALSYTTATAAATAAYPTAPVIFDASQVSCGLGGTLTLPTTLLAASGLTAFAEFKSFKVEVDQKIDTGRWILSAGGRNQPVAGQPQLKFSGKAEYNSTTVPTALAAGTMLPFYATWTTGETLGAGTTQLQVVVPAMRITKGLPAPKAGETVELDVDADIFNTGVAGVQDLYVVYRTTDTAL